MQSAHLRILVVEDNASLCMNLAALLERQGHLVDFAADGVTGLRLALQQPPDVLVLDLTLPGLDGLRVCERLRREADRYVPVLMLTARDTVGDKLAGFEAGADDYLTKPFSGEELLARCLALSRRHRLGASQVLELGSLRIDRRAGKAWRGDRPLELHQTPFRILLELAEASPRTLTRSELIDRLWGDSPPQSDPLRSHLYLLRQVLDRPFQTPMLRTVHGVGYALVPDR